MRSSMHSGRVAALLLPMAIALAGAGCNEHGTFYVVEMTPVGDGLERRLSICAHDSTHQAIAAHVDGDQADRLERAYRVRPDTMTRYTVRGRFDDIPEDIGNWGAYRMIRTGLGSSAVYVERFRGDPHTSRILNRPLAAADSAYGLLHTWLAFELDRQPQWPALETELEREVRPWLRDVYSALYISNVLPGSDVRGPIMVQMYEHPDLVRLSLVGEDEDYLPAFFASSARAGLLARLARTLQLGPDESPRVLAFLADGERMDSSFRSALGKARNLPPEGVQELLDSVEGMVPDPLGTESYPDSLEVRLRTGTEPYQTNGEWNEDTGSVLWLAAIAESGADSLLVPVHCYASWAVPDSAAQHRLFGRLLIEDETLANYCMLYAHLDAKQREEWDQTVASVGPRSLKRLERFRFADERARGMKARDKASLAYPLARMIVFAAHPPKD
jgi:hypothetical protein